MNQSYPKQIAFIQASWHKEIVDQCRQAFVAEMARQGIAEDRIEVVEVPGSFEIPLRAKLLAKSGRYAAIVAAGFTLYATVGIASMLLGANYLDYSPLGSEPAAGQHYGILIIEFGVGVTVAAVMIMIFYCFATRGR